MEALYLDIFESAQDLFPEYKAIDLELYYKSLETKNLIKSKYYCARGDCFDELHGEYQVAYSDNKFRFFATHELFLRAFKYFLFADCKKPIIYFSDTLPDRFTASSWSMEPGEMEQCLQDLFDANFILRLKDRTIFESSVKWCLNFARIVYTINKKYHQEKNIIVPRRMFEYIVTMFIIQGLIEKSEKDRYYNLLIDNYTIKNEIDVHPSFYQWVLILGIIRGIPKEIMQETYTNDMLPLIPEQYIDEFKIIKLRHKSLF